MSPMFRTAIEVVGGLVLFSVGLLLGAHFGKPDFGCAEVKLNQDGKVVTVECDWTDVQQVGDYVNIACDCSILTGRKKTVDKYQ